MPMPDDFDPIQDAKNARESAVKTAKHTPGPWVVLPFPKSDMHHSEVCTAGMKTPVAVVRRFDGDNSGKMAEANARLIAAAPDLLAACRAILGLTTDDSSPAWDMVRDAIRKATGDN